MWRDQEKNGIPRIQLSNLLSHWMPRLTEKNKWDSFGMEVVQKMKTPQHYTLGLDLANLGSSSHWILPKTSLHCQSQAEKGTLENRQRIHQQHGGPARCRRNYTSHNSMQELLRLSHAWEEWADWWWKVVHISSPTFFTSSAKNPKRTSAYFQALFWKTWKKPMDSDRGKGDLANHHWELPFPVTYQNDGLAPPLNHWAKESNKPTFPSFQDGTVFTLEM